MTSYRVIWEIDIDAENETEAARQALEIQRDNASIATVFKVQSSTLIDLSEEVIVGGIVNAHL